MTDETTRIATAAALLDDPYAALSQHLHGDGETCDPIVQIAPMKWATEPTGALYASDGLGGEWIITHFDGRSRAEHRHGPATTAKIGADIPAPDMAKLVQRLRDDRIRALIDAPPNPACATPDCTNRPVIRLDDRHLCRGCYATHDFGDDA